MPSKKGSGKPDSLPPPPPDDLDNYFLEGDLDEDDPFASPKGDKTGSNIKRKKPGDELGLDEEVSAAKKPKAPRVKLDAEKLLSDKGLAELRRMARDLELKGKGHEWGDAARLLSLYQGWLDGLFPRGKFLDALAMVEKTGHNQVVKKVREAMINEDRPKTNVADEDEDVDGAAAPARNEQVNGQADRQANGHASEQANRHFVPRPPESERAPRFTAHPQPHPMFPFTPIGGRPLRRQDEVVWGDFLDPTPPPPHIPNHAAAQTGTAPAVGAGTTQPRHSTRDGDDIYGATPPPPDRRNDEAAEAGGEPDGDELDALMAADEASGSPLAMRLAGEQATSISSGGNHRSAPAQPENNDDDNDDDDLDALIAEAEAEQATRQNASTTAAANMRGSATADAAAADDIDELDDLDALMADAEAQNASLKPAMPGA